MKPLACLTIAISALVGSNAIADTYKLNVFGSVDASIETNDINRFAGDTMSASITFDAPTATTYYTSPIPMDVKFFANGVYHGNLQSGGYTVSYVNTTNANGSFSLAAGSFIDGHFIVDTLTLFGTGKVDANPVTIGLANISSWSFLSGSFSGAGVGNSANGPITSYVLTNITSGLVVSAAPVPEPETYAMLLAGLCLLSAVARRRPGLEDGSIAPRSN